MHIAIIGCGTAGQASAIALGQDALDGRTNGSKQQTRITLFERVPKPGPIGAGLLLQPTGMHALNQLGLLDTILALGSRVDRLHGASVHGRVVLDMGYSDLDPRRFGLGIHRGALFATLQSAVLKLGIELRAGVEVRSIRQDECSVWIDDQNEAKHGPFDVVIVADGARSTLRTASHLVSRVRQYPWSAMWTVVDDPDNRYGGVLRQVYHGTSRMLGFLPSGRLSPSGVQTVSMFWSVHTDDLARTREHGLEAWKREALSLCEDARPALDRVVSMDQLISAPYFDVVLKSCVDGRVVYIGDAAHATSPQLGQGANLALVDAITLAEELVQLASHSEGTSFAQVHAALRRYEGRRVAQTRFYQRASRVLTPIFQSSWDAIAWPRDRVFAPIARIGWVRKQALLSLAGVKTGAFRADALPEMAETMNGECDENGAAAVSLS